MNAQTPPALPNQDQEHLRLLVIFHYVVAGILALFSFFPLIYVGLGAMAIVSPEALGGGAQPPPEWFGWFFILLGSGFAFFGWAMAACAFISGRSMAKRRGRMFSFVVAAILCLFMPFGTVLGTFTIIVLNRQSVRQLYEAEPAGPHAA
ncbi:hypothetical protein OH491_17115 [Termitidicoccus mucosus]|uniref:Transmembrane protein n=1 Tax=Termitidicoccus mucosus TaxID=1184151 RepID=A0A178IL65_9BACT|nr:hypothetical protein AW736_11475 [Opitutaceae bacterium TSB47]